MTFSQTTRLFGIALLLTSGAAANADRIEPLNATEAIQISDHHVFNSDTMVDGATVLIRDRAANDVTATIMSRALEPDTAYSIWWAVFNYPKFCLVPFECGLADLGANGDPRVKPSVFWGGGFISDIYGLGQANIRLKPGRTQRELFANTQNFGLENLFGAEIHTVLRTHGSVGGAGPVSLQVGTALQACPSAGCANVFASIHRP